MKAQGGNTMQTIMRQLLYSIAAGADTVLVTIAAQTGSTPPQCYKEAGA